MARQRLYSSNAERQKAFRDRQKKPPVKKKVPIPRPLSRPKRLQALLKEAEALLEGYAAWLENLPENLQGCGMADRLQETVDTLEQVVDLVSSIEAPKGFGRD